MGGGEVDVGMNDTVVQIKRWRNEKMQQLGLTGERISKEIRGMLTNPKRFLQYCAIELDVTFILLLEELHTSYFTSSLHLLYSFP